VVGLLASALAQTKPQYQVYALRYAILSKFPIAELVQGADPTRKEDIAMLIWLVTGNGHNILVDSGFYRDRYFHQYQVKDYIRPSEMVKEVGLKPDDITDIIISHMHWDHADGMDLFPKAHIWIQKDEYEYYTGPAWASKDASDGVDPDDVVGLVKRNVSGGVTLVNGDDQQVLPGIQVYIGGKHTYQSQYAGVNTKDGTVILASDNMYLYENLDKHVPIAATLDAASNLRAQDRMKQLAAKPQLIIPGHDPAEMTRFPQVAAHAVRIE
jgi:glyoxylase-like metal-dependent hydrolase (beta-lactamase superfamily II)